MEQLHLNGVLVPPRYKGKGLTIKVKQKKIRLTSEQEEMAVAWAKKVGTPYVEDPVFAKNFHRDFSKKLGINVKPGDVDYSEVLSFVEKERDWKANLSKEERKQLAAQRKAKREANKERYGYAWVDGVQMEVGNYAVEPSSIFMGRGKHPLRGRWKEGSREEDVELNLSPDALRPPGNWKVIVWQPDAMWIARWRDKLTGKTKYVGFSDSSILKQRKDIEKFDKARELRRNLARVQKHIWENLDAYDLRRRKTATVCFLIDKLKIRVGDEKDPDEADTVGASTLRPEHIRFNGDGTVTFNFLGKDSVPHVFRVELPDNVIRNLKEFAANAKSTLFDGVGSKHVSEFLDEVMAGLSAKAFRTCYASEAVETKLEKAP
ncbi:MAG: DNA topoisomerase I, partial [Candidatus Bathyarchaeia archaeon]